jgi:hypothetical protein
MLKKIREILLTQYIGSILVALLVCQALIEMVVTVVRNGFWFFNSRRSAPVSSGTPYPWDNLIFSLVSAALYLLIAYLMARWLYPHTRSDDTETGVHLKSETEHP